MLIEQNYEQQLRDVLCLKSKPNKKNIDGNNGKQKKERYATESLE